MAKPHVTIPTRAAERPELFWRKVDKKEPGECWNWKGVISQYGYGVAIRHSAGVRFKLQAHRLAYFIHHGTDPLDLCVCHTCDNPACCNPAHLFLGTIGDNNKDMCAKGRQRFIAPPARRGTAHHDAKLTELEVRAIRVEYSPFVKTRRMLAQEYGVSRGLIDKILARQLWAHLD